MSRPTMSSRSSVAPTVSVAVITGPVKVGDEAVVGANSLVVVDVPNKAVVVGVPAKILSYSGSAKLIRMPKDH